VAARAAAAAATSTEAAVVAVAAAAVFFGLTYNCIMGEKRARPTQNSLLGSAGQLVLWDAQVKADVFCSLNVP